MDNLDKLQKGIDELEVIINNLLADKKILLEACKSALNCKIGSERLLAKAITKAEEV